jgi:hypothetical protein
MLTITPTDFTGSKVSATESTPQPVVETQIPVQEKPKDPMSPQFAALARKERMIREQARQIQAEKQSMQSKLDEIKTQTESQWKQKLIQNPWDAMIEAGVSPEQATQMMLNQPKPEEIELQKMRREIEALRSSQDQSKDLMKQQQDEQYKQAKKQIGTEVKLLVDSDEAFETIKAMSAQDAVTELIEQTFLKDGHLMSVDDAAKEVEDYLIEQAFGLAKLKKVQARLLPGAVQTAQKQNLSQKPQLNTLSNRMNPTTKPLTDRERKQRAILAFQGKL